MTDYSYLDLLEEARFLVVQELHRGEITDLINDIQNDDKDFYYWQDTIGHILSNNRNFVDSVARIYMKKYQAKIEASLEGEEI